MGKENSTDSFKMDSEQKAHVIKLLERNNYPRFNALMDIVTKGENNIQKMIEEIQAETAEGFRFLGEILCAEENTED
jgi:hypothetical protein